MYKIMPTDLPADLSVTRDVFGGNFMPVLYLFEVDVTLVYIFDAHLRYIRLPEQFWFKRYRIFLNFFIRKKRMAHLLMSTMRRFKAWLARARI